MGRSSPSPSLLSDGTRPRHTRRISVTPSDLTFLADQNQELLQKLEKLEEESAQADLQGKRKLRKLEKEIGLLKEELEKTRERGAELEERVMKKVARQGTGDDAQEDEKRREREDRVRALRRKSTESDAETAVQDFAPPPELPKAKVSIPESIPEEDASVSMDNSEASDTSTNVVAASSSGALSALTVSSSTSSAASLQSTIPPSLSQTHPLEYAIIAQLLSKIHELEETNTQISAEQQTTAERLAAAHREVENVRRAYEYLGHGDDNVEVCFVPDDEADGSIFEDSLEGDDGAGSSYGSPLRSLHIPTGQTIRFSSLRRSIEGDTSRLALVDDPKDDFANGIVRQSTTRSILALETDDGSVRGKGKDKKPKAAGQKARKSVVGLFDGPGQNGVEGSDAPGRSGKYPPALNIPSFRALSPLSIRPTGTSDELGDISGWSNAATDNDLSRSLESSSSSPSDDSVYASPLPPSVEFLLPESRSPSSSPPQSPSPSPSTLNVGMPLHTLGSELGSEFGDDWGERAGNHHLRATSLYDLSADTSLESSGSVPGGWILDGDEAEALSEPDYPRGPEIEIESEDDHVRVLSAGTSTVVARSVSGGSASGSATPNGTVAGTPTKSRFSFHDHHNPQVVVQPPTPSPNKYKASSRGLKASRSKTGLRLTSSVSMPGDGSGIDSALQKDKLEKRNARNARLSQTVRARTNRWVERRYAEGHLAPSLSPVLSSPTLPFVPFPTSQDPPLPALDVNQSGPRRRRSTMGIRKAVKDVPERRRRTASTMDESFEEAVHRVSRSISFSASGSGSGSKSKSAVDMAKFREMELNFDCSDIEPERDSPHPDQGAFAAHPPAADVTQVTKKSGFVGFVLEIWLWLQFTIVVMVFLWAMARKGPKSVLKDAERSQRQTLRR